MRGKGRPAHIVYREGDGLIAPDDYRDPPLASSTIVDMRTTAWTGADFSVGSCTSSSGHYDGLNRAVIRSCTSSGVSSSFTVPSDQTWPNGSTTQPKRSP